jgi:hypothetical protein
VCRQGLGSHRSTRSWFAPWGKAGNAKTDQTTAPDPWTVATRSRSPTHQHRLVDKGEGSGELGVRHRQPLSPPSLQLAPAQYRSAVRHARDEASREGGKHERRFPPPWTVVEENAACFIVKDATGHALAYIYFEEEPGRPSAARLLTRDEARRIAANIAKLPDLLRGSERPA